MTKKYKLSTAFLFLIVFLVSFICNGECSVQVTHSSQTWIYNHVKHMINHYKLENHKNSYKLEYGLRQRPGKPAQYYIGVAEPVPHCNFRRSGFISFTLNDIRMDQLEPKHIQQWEKPNEAGVDTIFNVDGIKVTLRCFMRVDSDICWGEISIENPLNKSIDNLKVRFNCSPGSCVKQNKWHRLVVTAERTLSTQKKYQRFTGRPTENWFFCADKDYDVEKDPDKSSGPCFLFINRKNVEKIEIGIGDSYAVSFDVFLNRNASTFTFGIWEHMKKMSNSNALKLLKEQVR